MGATGALAIFSLGDRTPQVAEVSAAIICIIAIFGFIRFFVLHKTIEKIDNYLADLEKRYGTLGWTGSYRWQVLAGDWLARVRGLLWVVLFIFGMLLVHQVAAHPQADVPHPKCMQLNSN